MRPPLIEAPIYLSGAPLPDGVGDQLIDVCKKASPFAGVVAATLFGATVAYFLPKVFDHYLNSEGAEESDTVELEVEPRND